MTPLIIAAVITFIFLLWFIASRIWSDSIRHQQQILHGSVGQQRFGWRCARCGKINAPLCGHEGCTGALIWTRNQKRIICGRCGRHFVAQPWLFREVPRPWPQRCKSCGWYGIVHRWDTE